MKTILKIITISAVSAVVGFTSVFGGTAITQKKNSPIIPAQTQIEERPSTPQKRLLNKIMKLKTFNIDGSIDLRTQDDFVVNVGLDVNGDISDISHLRIKGDLNLNLNGIPLTSELAYIEDTMYFTFGNTNFSLETDNLMDFVEFLPEMGLNLELPSEITNLDLNSITAVIDGIEYVETPAGDYFFVADIMGLNLKILTDAEYSFKGIRMDKTDFDGTEVGLNFAITEVDSDTIDLVSPVAEAPLGTFKPLEPAFNIFKSLYNTFSDHQNTIGIELGLSKFAEEKQPIIDANLDLSYDIDEMAFSISGSILENQRSHDFDAFFNNGSIYFGYQDLKVSIATETIFNSLAYLFERLNVDLTQEALNIITELLNDEDFKSQLSGIENLVAGLTLEDDYFSIKLDTDAISLGLGTIEISVEFENGKLKAINIPGIKILNVGIEIKVTTKEYSPKELIKEDYEEIEPALTLVSAILPLLEETQFRIEFDGNIGDGNIETNDVLINGGLQFDIEDKFGYGDITVTDKKLYKHNIKGDMENPDEFFFSYNDKTNGKFTSRTINEVLNLVLDIIQNPDEHFNELFGDLMEKIMNMPIMQAINGDIGIIFDTNIINDLQITDDKLAVNIDLALANFNASFDLEINYRKDEVSEKSFIDGLSIKNLNLDGTTVEFNAYLKPFDQAKASERLDVTDKTKYLDFSDIKVLLALGINTSKFDYFHFKATLNLNIGLSLIGNIDPINIDIQIRNYKGHVQVAAEFESIPTIILVNTNSDYTTTHGRKASIYYDDGTIYLKRVDDVTKIEWVIFSHRYDAYYSRKMTSDYFLDNIAEILISDLFGMHDSIKDLIIGDGSSISSTGDQIKYEEILAGFAYNPNYNETKGQFDVKVNLKSLLNLSIFDVADLYVYTDKENEQLDSIQAKLTIHVLINVNVELSVNTLGKEQLDDSNKLTTLNEWVASRLADPVNELVTYAIEK